MTVAERHRSWFSELLSSTAPYPAWQQPAGGRRRERGGAGTSASASSRRHSHCGSAGSRGSARPPAIQPPGRPCHGTSSSRRRTPASRVGDRSGPASRAPGGGRTGPAPANRGSDNRVPAGSGTSRCSQSDAAGRAACGNPSRSTRPEPGTCVPQPKTPPAPAIRRPDARRTTPSPQSSATHPGSDASPSAPGTGPHPPARRRQLRPRKDPPQKQSPLAPDPPQITANPIVSIHSRVSAQLPDPRSTRSADLKIQAWMNSP